MGDAPQDRRGRPSKFTPEVLRLTPKLVSQGFTDAQLAEFFEVNEDTIHEWKKVHPEFSESLKEGKAISDSKVERSLYERAMGYSHPEVHVSNFQGQITLTPLTKHYAPDTAAAIFWLKNRRPAEWREKVEHQHSGNLDIKVTIGGANK